MKMYHIIICCYKNKLFFNKILFNLFFKYRTFVSICEDASYYTAKVVSRMFTNQNWRSWSWQKEIHDQTFVNSFVKSKENFHYSLLHQELRQAETCFEGPGCGSASFAKFSGGSASLMIDHIRGWQWRDSDIIYTARYAEGSFP